MRLQALADAQAFLAAADELLSRDEARHNLIYAICSTLIESPSAYEEAFFWTVEEADTLAALLRTPPFNIAVAWPRTPEALTFAADELHAQGLEVPGVSGALPEADIFASAWEKATSAPHRVRMSHGVYAAHEARVPDNVPGELREAEARERELAVNWISAFQDEALEEDAPHLDLERAVDRRIESRSAGFALWEVDAEPVSLCGYGGRTPPRLRGGPGYTPPGHPPPRPARAPPP